MIIGTVKFNIIMKSSIIKPRDIEIISVSDCYDEEGQLKIYIDREKSDNHITVNVKLFTLSLEKKDYSDRIRAYQSVSDLFIKRLEERMSQHREE